MISQIKKLKLKFPWNTAKMVKNLQCLKTLQMCYLGHAEHHAKNRTSLSGLDQKTLFFDLPLINSFFVCVLISNQSVTSRRNTKRYKDWSKLVLDKEKSAGIFAINVLYDICIGHKQKSKQLRSFRGRRWFKIHSDFIDFI